MGDYKDKNGTSFVGDILRKLGKKETLSKVLTIIGSGFTGNWGSVIDVVTNSKEMEGDDVEVVLKEIERDIAAERDRTERWKLDMNSDSWMSKNARPIALYNMLLMFDMIVIAALFNRELRNEIVILAIPDVYITLFTAAFLTVLNGYFVLRTIEKNKRGK
jgi:hypothetical protein